ncbi:hypothetical protein JCM6882_003985 [Rhodosporidiobolus microsporus]
MYDELKIIVEGTLVLEDRAAGIKIEGHPGDVINIKKGTTITFSSPNFSKARLLSSPFMAYSSLQSLTSLLSFGTGLLRRPARAP